MLPQLSLYNADTDNPRVLTDYLPSPSSQELAALRSQVSHNVNVEVDAAPQQDLNRVLEEIRSQYETMIDKHRRDQEAWFNDKVGQKGTRSVHADKLTNLQIYTI